MTSPLTTAAVKTGKNPAAGTRLTVRLLSLMLAFLSVCPVVGNAQQPSGNAFTARQGGGRSTAADPNLLAQYNGKLDDATLLFTENRGQVADAKGIARPDVLFTAHSGGAHVFLTASGIHYQFARTIFPSGYEHDQAEVKDPKTQAALRKQIKTETHRFSLSLEGANAAPRVRKEERSSYTENFYLAHCPNGITGVSTYKRVVFEEVYPGIDWVVYSNGQGMKYDFIVHPGADPSMIRLKVSDAERVSVAADGKLEMSTTLGSVTEQKPVSYCNQQPIETSFIQHAEDRTIGFAVADWDETKTLLIDPTVSWATYYGGASLENGRSCAIDASGNVYLAGQTGSSGGNVIASAGHQNTHGGDLYDAFLVKFNSAGVRQWGTYYGGGGDDIGYSCAVVGNDVYLAGYTATSGGISIATANGFQPTYGGGDNDAFLVKFSDAGVRQWGTYYGGSSDDQGYSCAATATDVYLAGYTSTSSANNAIATANGYQSTYGGGFFDAFVVKFSSAGARQWGTYYGGDGSDWGFACEATGSDVYLAGYTTTSTGTAIASAGSHQPAYGGGDNDAFLVKLNSAGARQWGTYYGGAGRDRSFSIAATGSDVYLVGYTTSTTDTSIATAGSHKSVYTGSNDAFLVKFSDAGVRQWGTYYGGSGSELGYSVAVAGNDVYLAGYTATSTGTSIATANGHQPTYGGGQFDAFLAKFSSAGVREWGTYHGGNDRDFGFRCAAAGTTVYLIGQTASLAGIATAGSQPTFGGGDNDAFMVKIIEVVPAPEINVTGNSNVILDGSATPSTTNHTDFGTGAVSRTFTIENTGTAALSITSITLSGPNASAFSISGAPATVAANSSATFTVNFAPAAPGVFTATVTISNNDADEATYDFAIAATSCPAITTQPMDATICAGAPATFNVQASGSVTYQWRRSGVAIPGAMANSYTTPSTTPADSNVAFDVVITPSPAIVGCASLTSDAATLTVNRHRWTGTVSTAWTDPANWNGCGVPTATSFVHIPAPSPAILFMPVVSTAVSVWQLTSEGSVTAVSGGDLQILGN